MHERLRLPSGLDGELSRQHLPGYLHRRHHHDELEANLVLQGEATYLIGQRICRITRGSLVWLFPEQDHGVVSRSDDYTVWVGYWRADLVARTCARGSAAILRSRDPEGWFSRRLGEAPVRRLDRLFAEVHATAGEPAHHRAGLAWLLLTLWEAFGSGSLLAPGTLIHPAVENACRLLGDGGGGDLRAIARRSGLSYPRLCLRFRREMGTTLTQYRNRCRIDRFLARHDPARHRLLASALDAGFGSYAQFHRVFSDLVGASPQAWCRAQLAGAGPPARGSAPPDAAGR